MGYISAKSRVIRGWGETFRAAQVMAKEALGNEAVCVTLRCTDALLAALQSGESDGRSWGQLKRELICTVAEASEDPNLDPSTSDDDPEEDEEKENAIRDMTLECLSEILRRLEGSPYGEEVLMQLHAEIEEGEFHPPTLRTFAENGFW
jgi:hypothetical protein